MEPGGAKRCPFLVSFFVNSITGDSSPAALFSSLWLFAEDSVSAAALSAAALAAAFASAAAFAIAAAFEMPPQVSRTNFYSQVCFR
jgi:hypothetical protein